MLLKMIRREKVDRRDSIVAILDSYRVSGIAVDIEYCNILSTAFHAIRRMKKYEFFFECLDRKQTHRRLSYVSGETRRRDFFLDEAILAMTRMKAEDDDKDIDVNTLNYLEDLTRDGDVEPNPQQ